MVAHLQWQTTIKIRYQGDRSISSCQHTHAISFAWNFRQSGDIFGKRVFQGEVYLWCSLDRDSGGSCAGASVPTGLSSHTQIREVRHKLTLALAVSHSKIVSQWAVAGLINTAQGKQLTIACRSCPERLYRDPWTMASGGGQGAWDRRWVITSCGICSGYKWAIVYPNGLTWSQNMLSLRRENLMTSIGNGFMALKVIEFV